jgi:hypothetical protein
MLDGAAMCKGEWAVLRDGPALARVESAGASGGSFLAKMKLGTVAR